MVNAILEGRKTQTRRVVKSSPCTCGNPPSSSDHLIENIGANQWVCASFGYTGDFVACPYGKVGDRLWVRETWYDDFGLNRNETEKELREGIYYRADGEAHDQFEDYADLKWRPSIFMPRWASRITLEITNVRVERLQDISAKDAWDEGVIEKFDSRYSDVTTIHRFRTLWDEINGKPRYAKGAGFGGETKRVESTVSWESNPWVWVVEFKKI